MSPFWFLLQLRMMEVMVITGAIRRAKLHSKCHQQQTNIPFFCRPNALPVAEPTVSEHWEENMFLYSVCVPVQCTCTLYCNETTVYTVLYTCTVCMYLYSVCVPVQCMCTCTVCMYLYSVCVPVQSMCNCTVYVYLNSVCVPVQLHVPVQCMCTCTEYV